jgi:hypothetical protein
MDGSRKNIRSSRMTTNPRESQNRPSDVTSRRADRLTCQAVEDTVWPASTGSYPGHESSTPLTLELQLQARSMMVGLPMSGEGIAAGLAESAKLCHGPIRLPRLPPHACGQEMPSLPLCRHQEARPHAGGEGGEGEKPLFCSHRELPNSPPPTLPLISQPPPPPTTLVSRGSILSTAKHTFPHH